MNIEEIEKELGERLFPTMPAGENTQEGTPPGEEPQAQAAMDSEGAPADDGTATDPPANPNNVEPNSEGEGDQTQTAATDDVPDFLKVKLDPTQDNQEGNPDEGDGNVNDQSVLSQKIKSVFGDQYGSLEEIKEALDKVPETIPRPNIPGLDAEVSQLILDGKITINEVVSQNLSPLSGADDDFAAIAIAEAYNISMEEAKSKVSQMDTAQVENLAMMKRGEMNKLRKESIESIKAKSEEQLQREEAVKQAEVEEAKKALKAFNAEVDTILADAKNVYTGQDMTSEEKGLVSKILKNPGNLNKLLWGSDKKGEFNVNAGIQNVLLLSKREEIFKALKEVAASSSTRKIVDGAANLSRALSGKAPATSAKDNKSGPAKDPWSEGLYDPNIFK